MADCHNIVIMSTSIREGTPSLKLLASLKEREQLTYLTFLHCYLGSNWDLYSGKTVLLPGFVLHFLSAFGHHFL